MARWTKSTTTRAGDLTEQYAQLVVRLGDGPLTTVIAVAPEQEFESSGVLDVLRTLRTDVAA